MQFDWVTFGFQLANVLILLAILHHFLFRPVAGIIERRQSDIGAKADAAEAARAEAEQAAAEARREAEKTASARHEMLGAARDDAEKERKALVEEARREAARIVAEARDEAARTVAGAEVETLHRARDLAETIVRRALSDLPDPPDIAGFAERLAAAVAALPEGRRQAVLSGGNLRLVAARPLSEEECQTARAALSRLGIEDPATEADPSLIAGLELRSASGVVHNSLAHDLSRIAEALKDGDGSRP